MPELPEVESVIRTLRDGDPSLVSRLVEKVNVLWPGALSQGASHFKERLCGARFKAPSRHGKYILLELLTAGQESLYLVVHLRMTGRLLLVPQAEAIAPYTRLALELDKGLALRFDDPRKFGRVWLVDDPAILLSSLGPDALATGFEEFASRLSRIKRQLKPLLLDQSFMAGIGNIYADESLFRAGLHPLANSGDLSPAEVRRLHAALMSVLHEAVTAQGANIDGVFKAGRFVVAVYRREGKPCHACGTLISKIKVAQRGTRFCSRCQPLPETHRFS